MALRFKAAHFSDIWDHRLACFIPPNLVREVVRRANQVVYAHQQYEGVRNASTHGSKEKKKRAKQIKNKKAS